MLGTPRSQGAEKSSLGSEGMSGERMSHPPRLVPKGCILRAEKLDALEEQQDCVQWEGVAF